MQPLGGDLRRLTWALAHAQRCWRLTLRPLVLSGFPHSLRMVTPRARWQRRFEMLRARLMQVGANVTEGTLRRARLKLHRLLAARHDRMDGFRAWDLVTT